MKRTSEVSDQEGTIKDEGGNLVVSDIHCKARGTRQSIPGPVKEKPYVTQFDNINPKMLRMSSITTSFPLHFI